MHPWIGAGEEDQRHILSELGLQSSTARTLLFAETRQDSCFRRLSTTAGRDGGGVELKGGGEAETV